LIPYKIFILDLTHIYKINFLKLSGVVFTLGFFQKINKLHDKKIDDKKLVKLGHLD